MFQNSDSNDFLNFSSLNFFLKFPGDFGNMVTESLCNINDFCHYDFQKGQRPTEKIRFNFIVIAHRTNTTKYTFASNQSANW